jgi:hypothetical protein
MFELGNKKDFKQLRNLCLAFKSFYVILPLNESRPVEAHCKKRRFFGAKKGQILQ